jgi:hypothetical protein
LTPSRQPHKYEAVSIEGIRSSLQRALREMREMSAERQTTADKMDVELAAADKQVRILSQRISLRCVVKSLDLCFQFLCICVVSMTSLTLHTAMT